MKLAQESEDFSNHEIEELQKEKESLRKEIQKMKSEESQIVSSEIQSLKTEISRMENEVEQKLSEISELKELNKKITESASSSFVIKEKLSDNNYRVSVKSKLGGTHQFSKAQDFSEYEILNSQRIYRP